MITPSKSELIQIMANHTINEESELLNEIVNDFYKSYTEDDLIQFWIDAGYLEAQQEQEWLFKAQQGPL
jgi:hypothetical protein